MVPWPCRLKALPVNLIGSNVVRPCAIENTTSAESNAVFPDVRGRSLMVDMFSTAGSTLASRSKWRQLTQIALSDVCLAAAVKIADIIPQATELDPGIDIALVRLPARNRACIFLKLCAMDRQLRVVVRIGIERDPAIFAEEITLQEAALHAYQAGDALLDRETATRPS